MFVELNRHHQAPVCLRARLRRPPPRRRRPCLARVVKEVAVCSTKLVVPIHLLRQRQRAVLYIAHSVPLIRSLLYWASKKLIRSERMLTLAPRSKKRQRSSIRLRLAFANGQQTTTTTTMLTTRLILKAKNRMDDPKFCPFKDLHVYRAINFLSHKFFVLWG